MTVKISNNQKTLKNILLKDGILAVPTDTVFGLCARIYSENTLEKLRDLKHRPSMKAFPIMCANLSQIEKIAELKEKDYSLIKAFMPGPITMIFKRNEELPSYINDGMETIAIRMATSKELESLLLTLGEPVYMTSANISGEKECESIEEIIETFPSLSAIMKGDIQYGCASTILDTTKDYTILRNGPISKKEIERILCKTKS